MNNRSFSAASILADMLYSSMKPRSRSEWEDRFIAWQKPASETEEQKIEIAKRKVGNALQYSRFLKAYDWEFIPQGSYHNNTNVRTESDVDLCVCLKKVYEIDGPPNNTPSLNDLNLDPLNFTFLDYKTDIAASLQRHYGQSEVQIGKKAIHINKDSETRISVDVVPTFTYQLFPSRRSILGSGVSIPYVGVALRVTDDRRLTNFPRQHYDNGILKNNRTSRRFKRVVRILKRLRTHMIDNPNASFELKNCARNTPSFLIESLVYNCPDNLFNNPSIFDDVVNVLQYLSQHLNEDFYGPSVGHITPQWSFWTEVNGIKNLFRIDSAFSVQTAQAFVSSAKAYMEV